MFLFWNIVAGNNSTAWSIEQTDQWLFLKMKQEGESTFQGGVERYY